MEFDGYDNAAVMMAVQLANHWVDQEDDAVLGAWVAANDRRDGATGHAAAGDLPAVRALGEQLWHVFAAAHDGDQDEAVRRLNALLDEAQVHPQVAGHDGRPLHLHFAPHHADSAQWLAASAAMALATMIAADGDTARMGLCAADDCRWAYVDTSRNRSRRYCDDGCGTRVKVAAYRARRKAAGQVAGQALG